MGSDLRFMVSHSAVLNSTESDPMEPLVAAIQTINEKALSDDLVAAKCRGLMIGYHNRWIALQGQFEVLSVEETLTSDMYNPVTGRTSRSFSLAGKIDVRARRHGRQVIVDHKTCSEDITDPNSSYWRQLVVEGQVNQYMLLEWLNGRKVDEAVWDVIRKPQISPKKLSKAEVNAVVSSRKHHGASLSEDDVVVVAETSRETLGMYEARLAFDCTEERPDWYFQRRSVPRLDHELEEYATEVWNHGQELLSIRRNGWHSRNSGACMNYGRPCRFLGICSGHDSDDSGNWTTKQRVHAELPDLPGDGREYLTNSRIRTFQTCRRKHYFEYERGIQRIDEEETETLYFGGLLHEGLAAWWSAFIQQESVNGNDNTTGSQVNEVWTADSCSPVAR